MNTAYEQVKLDKWPGIGYDEWLQRFVQLMPKVEHRLAYMKEHGPDEDMTEMYALYNMAFNPSITCWSCKSDITKVHSRMMIYKVYVWAKLFYTEQ